MNMNILKKVLIGLIVSCVIITSMPCFSIKSEALGSAGGYIAYESAQAYLTYITAYLASRGISAPSIVQDPDNTLVMNSSPSVVENFVNSFIDKLKLANAAQTTAVLYALERAKNSGVFSLSSETDSFLREYLDSITVDSQLILGQSNTRFNSYSSSDVIDFFSVSFTVSSENHSVVYAQSTSFTIPYDYLPVVDYEYQNGMLYRLTYYFLPSTRRTDLNGLWNDCDYTSVSDYSYPAYTFSKGIGVIGNTQCFTFSATFNNNSYRPSNFNTGDILTTVGATISLLSSISAYFIQNGYYDNALDLVSTQIYDTSNVDVLSVASEIDPNTAVVTPGFTYYMKDLSLFQELIQQFNQGILSWNSLIKSLGLSFVSSSATVVEKQQAMDKVAYPDSTYDWLASTTWGETLTQPVVEEARKYHTEEVAKSNAIGDLLAYQTGGDLPEEDKEKAYNSMLLGSLLMWLGIWRPPNLSGEDPDGGGIGPEDPNDPYGTSGYIADTVAGVSVASGLIDAAFNSAGGSNGFGIVFTLGATFVIFSVLIGAANYFGSKGDDVENSNYSSKPNNRPARSKQKSKPHKVKKAG